MMGVPPSNLPPSSSPSGRSSESDKGRPKRPFNLRKEGRGDEKEEKKGLFDLKKEKEAKEAALEARTLAEEKASENQEAQESQALTGVEAKAAVAKAGELIMKMIRQMQIGEVDGKEFAKIDLKGKEDVPSFLANTTLMLSQTEKGLSIQFTNFETPQQQALAIIAIEKNKEQLMTLMTNLQAKNIQVTELQIGTQTVALPRVEPLPPPFRPSTSSQMDQRQGRQDQEGEKRRPPPPGPVR